MEIVELQDGKYAVRKFFFISFKEDIFFSWGYKSRSGRYFEEKRHKKFIEGYCTFDTYEQALEVKNKPKENSKIKIKRLCG